MKRGIRQFGVRSVMAVFLLGGLAGVTVSRWLAGGAKSSLNPLSAIEINFAERALDQRIAEVWLDDVPFDEATQHVAQIGGVPIVIEVGAFQQHNVSTKTRVSLKLRNVPLAEVLDQLVAQVQGLGLEGMWYPSGNLIRIGLSGPLLPLPFAVRTYDVSDLLTMRLPDESEISDSHTDVIHHRLRMQRLAALSGGSRSAAKSPTITIEQMIKDHVAPDSWLKNLKYDPTIAIVGTRLVVVQTAANQRAIRAFLDQLRAVAVNPKPATRTSGIIRWGARLEQGLPEEHLEAEQRLWEKIAVFRVEQLPLTAALEQVGAMAGTNVVIAPSARRHVEDAHPVTVHLADTSIASILELVLLNVGGASDRGRALDWALDGEKLVILERREYPPRYVVTRQYDLRDWFATAAQLSNEAPYLKVGREIFASPPVEHDRQAGQLLELVSRVVDPLSWGKRVGSVGEMREIGGILFVTQTYSNQEQVRQLLETARRDMDEAKANAIRVQKTGMSR